MGGESVRGGGGRGIGKGWSGRGIGKGWGGISKEWEGIRKWN